MKPSPLSQLPWTPPNRVRPRDPRDVYQRALGAPVPIAADAKPKPRRRPLKRGSRPSAAIEAEYRARMERLVTEMAESVLYWMKAAYKANPPVMAMDGGSDVSMAGSDAGYRRSGAIYSGIAFDRRTPAEHLQDAFRSLAKRWQHKFDEAAPRLARWFATKASRRSDATLQHILKDGGFSVKFTMTPAAADIIDAVVAENVALIRSIPQQYLTQVEGAVMRSVRQGRDLGPLAKELREQYGVTKRRAALIARDQSNKATADMTRARQVEKGYKAIWRHSHGGKEPRPTHLANDGKTYDPVRGWYDPHEKKLIWPGTLIRCRCYSQTIIPGFEP